MSFPVEKISLTSDEIDAIMNIQKAARRREPRTTFRKEMTRTDFDGYLDSVRFLNFIKKGDEV